MAAQKKKAPGKAVAKWDEKLAEIAKRQKKQEASASSGGNTIQTRAATFVVNGGTVPGGKLKAIVVDSILENDFYEGAFDADNITSPACYAFGRDAEDMAPHEHSAKPQNDTCVGCPNNEFGSAETGKGKACSNRRRLMLVLEPDFENLEAATLYTLKVPPTSGGNWKGYVDSVEGVTKNKATCAVVTEISIAPHPKKQQEITFKLIEEIEDGEALGVIIEKLIPKAEKELFMPYAKPDEEEEPSSRKLPARGKKAAAPAAKPGKPKFAGKGRR